MADTVSSEHVLVASVLDRLIDEDPEAKKDAPRTRGQFIREAKQSVRRDLENLLNTRARATTWPVHLDQQLRKSLVAYGLPDLACMDAAAHTRRQDYERLLRNLIEVFEPRLQRVRVTLLDQEETVERVLRFRIQADLRLESASEPVAFQSLVEPTTGTVKVQGETG